MIRAIIKIPSAPPIDIAIMDNRGLDEWPGFLPPNCVEEVIRLCCVEEAVASNCVEEDVAAIMDEAVIVEIALLGSVTVLVIIVCLKEFPKFPKFPTRSAGNGGADWVNCIRCGAVLAGLITEAVDPDGQPNAAQGSTKQQPWYPILEHVQY